MFWGLGLDVQFQMLYSFKLLPLCAELVDVIGGDWCVNCCQNDFHVDIRCEIVQNVKKRVLYMRSEITMLLIVTARGYKVCYM